MTQTSRFSAEYRRKVRNKRVAVNALRAVIHGVKIGTPEVLATAGVLGMLFFGIPIIIAAIH